MMISVGIHKIGTGWTYRQLMSGYGISLTGRCLVMNDYSDLNSETWNCKVKCVNYVILYKNCVINFSGVANNFIRLEFSHCKL